MSCKCNASTLHNRMHQYLQTHQSWHKDINLSDFTHMKRAGEMFHTGVCYMGRAGGRGG